MYRKKIWKSDFAIKILKKLKEQESYPTKLGKILDSNAASVGNYLKGMRELGLIDYSRKERRKQYYCITDKGKKFIELKHAVESKKIDLDEKLKSFLSDEARENE